MWGASVESIVIMFGTARDLTDIIIGANFVSIRLTVSELKSKLEPPIGNRNGLYHCVLALSRCNVIYFVCTTLDVVTEK